jgi:hypothetical protein
MMRLDDAGRGAASLDLDAGAMAELASKGTRQIGQRTFLPADSGGRRNDVPQCGQAMAREAPLDER